MNQPVDAKGNVASRVGVMTVQGAVPVEQLGITLMHEHIFVDARSVSIAGTDPEVAVIFNQPVRADNAALLREDPYAALDNCILDDAETAVDELLHFTRRGGQTIVDATSWNIGRNPEQLVQVSKRTGLNIIMGTGLYRERAHPDWAKVEDDEAIAARIVTECFEGISVAESKHIRPGIIGEIGISKDFSYQERKSLRAAAKAQLRSGLPLVIHLPGWRRWGHLALDICESEGVNTQAIVLAHMDPSGNDPEYQRSLAERGVHLEFDALGMGLFFASEQSHAPGDEEILHSILALFEAGFGSRVLLSQDVFLKVQLRRYGGNGYDHLLRSFLPRLERHGLDPKTCRALVVDYPQSVFCEAASVTSYSS